MIAGKREEDEDFLAAIAGADRGEGVPWTPELMDQPSAQRDVREILYTFDTWGTGHRDDYRTAPDNAFERIGLFPEIGHPAE